MKKKEWLNLQTHKLMSDQENPERDSVILGQVSTLQPAPGDTNRMDWPHWASHSGSICLVLKMMSLRFLALVVYTSGKGMLRSSADVSPELAKDTYVTLIFLICLSCPFRDSVVTHTPICKSHQLHWKPTGDLLARCSHMDSRGALGNVFSSVFWATARWVLTHRPHYPVIDPSIATERIPSLTLICKLILSVPPPALVLSAVLGHTFQLYPTCLECFCPRLISDSCSEGLSWLSASASLPAFSGYVPLICLLVTITCWLIIPRESPCRF